MWLCHELARKEHVLKSVSTKDDLVTSCELVHTVEDLIPRVLGHEVDERVQTDDRLLIEMVENGRRKGIGTMVLASFRMNVLS
jgi:hypothetical protein